MLLQSSILAVNYLLKDQKANLVASKVNTD